MMFFTKVKLLTPPKTVLKFSLFQIFYWCSFLWSLEIQRFTKIISYNTAWIIPLSFKFSYISLRNRRNTWFEKHFPKLMDPVTATRWEKMSLPNAFVFFQNESTSLTSLSSNTWLWISALCYLILSYIFLLKYINLYIYVYWAWVYHYCILNILQHMKTVNKIWWYKGINNFFQTMFSSKIYII